MKIGIVTGSWDLLHAGHIHFLKECKQKCDNLLVGLQVDPSIERPIKNRPIESVLEREIKLSGCKYVAGVIVYEWETDLPILFQYFKVNIRFLGNEYLLSDKKISYPELLEIEYIDSLPIHTTDIRKRI